MDFGAIQANYVVMNLNNIILFHAIVSYNVIILWVFFNVIVIHVSQSQYRILLIKFLIIYLYFKSNLKRENSLRMVFLHGYQTMSKIIFSLKNIFMISVK